MKKIVCIALSRSRQRYFQTITEALGDQAAVLYAGQLKLAALRGLLHRFPSESQLMAAHFARQAINYPRLARIKPLWGLLKYLISVYERCRYFNYLAFFLDLKAEAIGVWNGQKQPYLTVTQAALAAGKRVLYFENGVLPNTTTMDYHGVNAANCLSRKAEFYLNWTPPVIQELPDQLVPYQQHKKRTNSGVNVQLPARYIFVPLQVPSDSQIVSQSPWITSMEQLFNVLQQANQRLLEQGHAAWQFVLKEHPAWPHHYTHLYHQDDQLMFANETNTQALIEGATAVLTINSTVGIESLLLGKSVITVGDAFYNIEGLVQHADHLEQLAEVFRTLEHWRPNPKLVEHFLKFVYFNYCIPSSWRQPNAEHIQAAQQRILEVDELARILAVFRHTKEHAL